MQLSDVISVAAPTEHRDDPAPVVEAPELWPVSLWDATWLVAGVEIAKLLLFVG